MIKIKIISFLSILFFSISNLLFAQSNQSQINYETMFYIYMKGTNTDLSNQIITNFIRDYHPSIYRSSHSNEFEWHDILDNHRVVISSKTTAIDLTSEYFLITGIELGNYDFDLEGFTVIINEGTYIPFYGAEQPGSLSSYSKPIALFLSYFNEYNLLKMSRNDGNAFLRARTRNNNTV